MNYSDFGVTCAEELEQDEWSLMRPTFETPKGGVLTVVGIAGRGNRGVKSYVIHCSQCIKDRELFGDGVFASQKGNLKRGGSPCGCSFNPVWSEEQQEIRIRRYAEKRGYIFDGWAGDFKGNRTKCRLICPEHGLWESTTLVDVLWGRGCPTCGGSVPHTRDTFIKKSIQKHGDIYDYVAVKNFSSNTSKVEIICRTHGPFIQRVANHLRGNGCPTCGNEKTANKTRKGKDVFVEKANKKHVFLYNYSKVRYNGAHEKVEIICKEHGSFYQSPNHHLRGDGCPICAGHTQRQAYIHSVWDVDVVVAIKLGIAKNWFLRLKKLNQKSPTKLINIGVWEFKTVKACKSAEKECKGILKTGVLSAREMKNGWTETVSVLDLEKVIAIYEKHGGKRIK